jgi:hypothetical protein
VPREEISGPVALAHGDDGYLPPDGGDWYLSKATCVLCRANHLEPIQDIV